MGSGGETGQHSDETRRRRDFSAFTLKNVLSLPADRKCCKFHEPVEGVGSQPPVTACFPEPLFAGRTPLGGSSAVDGAQGSTHGGCPGHPRRSWSAWPSPQKAPLLDSRETKGQPSDADRPVLSCSLQLHQCPDILIDVRLKQYVSRICMDTVSHILIYERLNESL